MKNKQALKIFTMLRNYILIFGLSIFLSNCTSESGCIAADDFGFDKVVVSARGVNEIFGSTDGQYVNWQDTGLIYNGGDAHIVVSGEENSSWAAWRCEAGGNFVCDEVKRLFNQTCKSGNSYWNKEGTKTSKDKFGAVLNAPCIFRGGVGLYGILVEPNSQNIDINSNAAINRNPKSLGKSFHFGDKNNLSHAKKYNLGGIKGKIDSPIDSKLYLKILDNYYADNAGSYKLIVKNGFERMNSGPIKKLISFVQNQADQMSEKMYKKLINNKDFRKTIGLLLILTIMIMGASFALGLLQMTQKTLFVKFVKIVIVAQLLTSANSYEFLNEYFFKFFTKGLEELVGIIIGKSSISGMNFFDDLTNLFLSKETSAKIFALLSYDFAIAIFAIPIFYGAIILVYLGIAYAVILYLVAYFAISFLIILSPIFITFLLFEYTSSFFQTWLRQLFSYFIQPLVIFASLGIVIKMIVSSMNNLLGFEVCSASLIDFPLFKDFKFWKMSPINLSKGKVNMSLPGYQLKSDDPEYLCNPYECTGERYEDLPFLDPVKDANLIDAIVGGNWFVYVGEMFVLLVICFLMYKLNRTIPDIAKSLAGAEFSQANLGRAAGETISTLKNTAATAYNAAEFMADKASGGKVSKFKKKVTKPLRKIRTMTRTVSAFGNAVSDKIGGAIDNVTSTKLDKAAKAYDDRQSAKQDERGEVIDKFIRRQEQKIADLARSVLGDAVDYLPFIKDHRAELKKEIGDPKKLPASLREELFPDVKEDESKKDRKLEDAKLKNSIISSDKLPDSFKKEKLLHTKQATNEKNKPESDSKFTNESKSSDKTKSSLENTQNPDGE